MILIKRMIVFILSLVILCINQIGYATDVTVAFGTGNMHYKIKKTSEAIISIPVRLSTILNEEINVDMEVTGGKSQLEDFGTGKHYTISGGLISASGYEKSKVTLTFPIGCTLKTATLAFVNNSTIDVDRTIKVTLTNTSNGAKISPNNSITIKLIDDQRLETIDVRNPGHGLAGLTGDGVTNVTDKLQKILNYVRDTGRGHVVYFPAGTYVVNKLLPTWGISLVGAGIDLTIIKKVDAQTVGNVSISRADPAVVTLPADHGLKNGATVFFTDMTALGGWMDLMQQAYRVRNLSGNTCNLEYTGIHPKRKTLVNTGSFTANFAPPGTMKLQFADHHTFNSTTYDGSNDSVPLSFRDMTIDGNSFGTGPWKYYEAEHSYAIFSGAKGTGYIKTVVENVHFKDLVAAGIHPYSKSDYNIYKITMNNGSTGGVCAISGIDVKVKAVNIIGSNDRPGEEPEFHSENAYNVNLLVRDLHIKGSLALSTQSNSTVDVMDTTVGRGLFLYAKDSRHNYKNVVSDSFYNSAGGFAFQSHAWADNSSITFDNCDFYANGKGAPAGVVLSAGPQVGFSFGTKVKNGTVTFKNSNFKCRDIIDSGCNVYGIYQATIETVTSNNNLIIDNCKIEGINRIFNYGFNMFAYGGGRVYIKNSFIDALCPISLSAQHTSKIDNQLLANLENLSFGNNTKKLYYFRINNAELPAATVNHINMSVPKSKNIIHTNWPITGNWKFNGSRIIMGDENDPGNSTTHGLVGDIYQKRPSGYSVCEAPVYYDERSGVVKSGIWTLQ